MIMLRVDNLKVSFGELNIVNGVSFSVEPGQWMMIVGPNGAGKSTIVNAISQGTAYTGDVFLEGRNVKTMPAKELAKALGVLSQSHQVSYSFSVDEYRRSVVMIKVNDEISYGVDFFRVLGGNEHIYSFHAASNNIAETAGFGEIAPQMKNGEYSGTLAGIDVPYGADPGTISGTLQYPKGYTWIDTIDYAKNPENKFEIDIPQMSDTSYIYTDNSKVEIFENGEFTDISDTSYGKEILNFAPYKGKCSIYSNSNFEITYFEDINKVLERYELKS